MVICAYAPKVLKAVNRRHVSESDYQKALEIISRYKKIYAVELAGYLGIRYSKAASLLINLEKRGFLRSWLEPAPKSGLGRRYYSIRPRG